MRRDADKTFPRWLIWIAFDAYPSIIEHGVAENCNQLLNKNTLYQAKYFPSLVT